MVSTNNLMPSDIPVYLHQSLPTNIESSTVRRLFQCINIVVTSIAKAYLIFLIHFKIYILKRKYCKICFTWWNHPVGKYKTSPSCISIDIGGYFMVVFKLITEENWLLVISPVMSGNGPDLKLNAVVSTSNNNIWF